MSTGYISIYFFTSCLKSSTPCFAPADAYKMRLRKSMPSLKNLLANLVCLLTGLFRHFACLCLYLSCLGTRCCSDFACLLADLVSYFLAFLYTLSQGLTGLLIQLQVTIVNTSFLRLQRMLTLSAASLTVSTVVFDLT